ncbi:hypothetical protein GW17_00031360 [Ensete ventricosum]|nr:hypothetical protein GW17_00031360 [Ensete ventricosum]
MRSCYSTELARARTSFVVSLGFVFRLGMPLDACNSFCGCGAAELIRVKIRAHLRCALRCVQRKQPSEGETNRLTVPTYGI